MDAPVPSSGASSPMGAASVLVPGLALGVLAGLFVAAVELGSAWTLRVLWSVDAPLLNVVVYAGCGALVGLGLGSLLLGLRAVPALRRRVDPAQVAASLGLAAWGVRTTMVIAMRPKDAPGGPLLFLGVCVVAGVLLALALASLLRPRVPDAGAVLRVGAAILLATLAGSLLAQVASLGGGFALGQTSLVLTQAASGLVALAVPLLLRPRVGAALGALLGLTVIAVLGRARAAGAIERDAPAAGPNVLLLVLDTLRLDAVSAYGFVDGTTPELDAFAAQGVLWETAISPSNWTVPGHASLFTGAQVSRHGCDTRREVLRVLPGGPGSTPLPTLAEVLAERGWRTSAFVCNSNLIGERGFDRGFDQYHEIWLVREGLFDARAHLLAALGPGRFDKGGAWTTDGLERWLAERAGEERPWFCFVNYMEPHDPYDAPQPWLGRFAEAADADLDRRGARALNDSARAYKYGGVPADLAARLWGLYLGCVAYQDHLVGRVLDSLDELGLAEDTVVIVTSDHGENFGWGERLYHGIGMNDGVLAVPLLARGPGIPAGVREGTPASLVDVVPTVLALAGTEPLPADPGRTGIVLPPLGPTPAEERTLLAERTDWFLRDITEVAALRPDVPLEAAFGREALLRGPWKAVRIHGDEADWMERRTRRPVPPVDEGRDRVDDAERLARMLGELDAWRGTWPQALDPDPEDIPELDEETLEELRKLGYVDG